MNWFCIVGFILVLGHSVVGQDLTNFNNYKLQYKKNYTANAEPARLKAFLDNELLVAKHNLRFQKGQTSFTLGTNKYSDMPHEEFKARMLGYKRQPIPTTSPLYSAYMAAKTAKPLLNLRALPASVDWRKSGWVSSVKDQGTCGSCFTFSACGAIEGSYAKKYGKLIDCSEQNLLDCTFSDEYLNLGCDGGEMWRCFQYVKDNGGMEAENTYNYMTKYTGECLYAAADKKITLSGYTFVAKTETALQAAVAIQPIAIALDASLSSFQFYKSGIYYEPECTQEVNHAALLVGYGRDAKGTDFWIIKNSLGTSWGESGYMRIARNKNNHCGIANDSSYPQVA